MALEVQNGGSEIESLRATTFSAMKPWLLVEASKPSDIVLFYEAAFGGKEVARVVRPKRNIVLFYSVVL
ncbi:hypothetical protein U1Q18_023397, partial [Sarracenia purpurea var. burkii]